MNQLSPLLIQTIRGNQQEILDMVSQKPDWNGAQEKFSQFFAHLSNPEDALWSASTFNLLYKVYFEQRDADNCSSNITIRTLAGMPTHLKNDTKIIFLQIADACCFFNGSHKVNFDSEELPAEVNEIKMIPAKAKGSFTYAQKTASLYAKTSLTFDYWVPKILDWTHEIRTQGLMNWVGADILEHDSCTDFMRLSLLFLGDTENNPPIAKSEDREKLMALLGEEFTWVKKSAKREDILGNNQKIVSALIELEKQTCVPITLEAWSRILYSNCIKPLIK